MKDEIWHWDGSLLKKSPKDALEQLIKADTANYYKATAELSETLELLDRAIALYIEALQGAYRMIDEWRSKDKLRAAMAMAGSVLNYILLARHSILLGYYPEARDLLRGCHERITRCYLFHADEEATKNFFAGQQIGQVIVDRKLRDLLGKDKSKEAIYSSLRDSYKSSSKVVHPNIESLVLRTLSPEGQDFKNRVGIDTVFGGVMSSNYGETVILPAISTIRFALKVIGAVIVEGTGKWEGDRARIAQEADILFERVKGEHTV